MGYYDNLSYSGTGYTVHTPYIEKFIKTRQMVSNATGNSHFKDMKANGGKGTLSEMTPEVNKILTEQYEYLNGMYQNYVAREEQLYKVLGGNTNNFLQKFKNGYQLSDYFNGELQKALANPSLQRLLDDNTISSFTAALRESLIYSSGKMKTADFQKELFGFSAAQFVQSINSNDLSLLKGQDFTDAISDLIVNKMGETAQRTKTGGKDFTMLTSWKGEVLSAKKNSTVAGVKIMGDKAAVRGNLRLGYMYDGKKIFADEYAQLEKLKSLLGDKKTQRQVVPIIELEKGDIPGFEKLAEYTWKRLGVGAVNKAVHATIGKGDAQKGNLQIWQDTIKLNPNFSFLATYLDYFLKHGGVIPSAITDPAVRGCFGEIYWTWVAGSIFGEKNVKAIGTQLYTTQGALKGKQVASDVWVNILDNFFGIQVKNYQDKSSSINSMFVNKEVDNELVYEFKVDGGAGYILNTMFQHMPNAEGNIFLNYIAMLAYHQPELITNHYEGDGGPQYPMFEKLYHNALDKTYLEDRFNGMTASLPFVMSIRQIQGLYGNAQPNTSHNVIQADPAAPVLYAIGNNVFLSSQIIKRSAEYIKKLLQTNGEGIHNQSAFQISQDIGASAEGFSDFNIPDGKGVDTYISDYSKHDHSGDVVYARKKNADQVIDISGEVQDAFGEDAYKLANQVKLSGSFIIRLKTLLDITKIANN